MEMLQQLRILLDILIAMIVGGIIGLDREIKHKPAGFRTNMIIAGASALLLILGRYLIQVIKLDLNDQALGVDPTRIIQAIIVGVSFIGAGTILKSREEETVHYLTTAATILMSSAVGICVALHLYPLAVGLAVLTVLVNAVLNKVFE